MSKTTEWKRYTASDGHEIAFPVATIKGDAPGPHFVITAGLHGCEYPGIAAAIAVSKYLVPEKLHGKVTIVTISSLAAFEARSMFVTPYDKKNPNRFFPGQPEGGYTDELVFHLFRDIISNADYHLDLHGGDMVEALEPFSLYHTGVSQEVDAISKEMAHYYGLPNLCATQRNGSWPDRGANYANSAEHRIPAIIAEVGGIGLMKETDVAMHVKGVKNVLRHFGVLEGEAEEPGPIQEYQSFVWLYSPVKGIYYKNIEVGDLIAEGQSVGRMENYFGEFLMELKAPVSGKILFLETSPAIAENGLVMGIGAI